MVDASTPKWHRLHPAMLLFQLAGILRRYFLLFVVGGVASSRGENFVNFVLLFTALTLAISLLRYLSYRYSLDDKYLTVIEGVFTKKYQRYLLDKINHVNRHQNPLAKWMKIVKLELQQEASNVPTLFMPAVTFKQADEIEELIKSRSILKAEISNTNPSSESSNSTDNSERQIIYQSSMLASFIEGVSSLPVRIFLLGGLLYRFYGQSFTPYLIDEYEIYVKTLANLGIERVQQFWLFILVNAIFAYLLALIVGICGTFVRRFKYSVVARSNFIFIVSGFFTRSTAVINAQQVQSLVGVANPIRRLLDLSQWQIVAPRPGRQRGRVSQLIPIGKSAEINRLLPAVWEDCIYPTENWVAVDPYHRRRLWLLTLFAFLVALGVVAAIDFFFNILITENLWQRTLSASLAPKIALGIIIVLVFALFRRMVQTNYAQTGYRLDEKFLFIKSAFLSKSIFIVPLEKIQAVIFKRSLMQIHRGLVTVELDINGSLRPVRLYNVNNKVAELLRAKAVNAINTHQTPTESIGETNRGHAYTPTPIS